MHKVDGNVFFFTKKNDLYFVRYRLLIYQYFMEFFNSFRNSNFNIQAKKSV